MCIYAIYNDIDKETEEELLYVALTRGKNNIYLDSPLPN